MSEPYVAFARVDYVGDGEERNFVVPFPFIDRSHVQLLVDGEPVAFEWLNDGLIQASVAPPAPLEGEPPNVRVARKTPAVEMLVQFSSPSSFRSEQVNAAFTQALYVCQEAFDLAQEGLGLATDLHEVLIDVTLLRNQTQQIADDVAEIEDDLGAKYADVVARYDEMLLALSGAIAAKEDAENAAEDAAAILALFPPLIGNAGKNVRVKLDETGFEAIAAAPGDGDLIATNNLSDLTDPAAARINLGIDLAEYLGQVANAGRMPSSFDSVNKQLMSRVPMQARDHIKSLQLLFANAYVNGSTETGSGAAAGIKASIEYPEGVFTQVLFSASATGSITNTSTLLSDSVTVDIPDGAEFWVRSYFTSTGGVVYNEKSNGVSNATVSGGTDKTMTGTVTDDGSAYSYSPLAVLGMTRLRTVVLLGDSHVVGRDDTPDATRDLGSLQRSIGPYFGTIVLAKSGDAANGYVGSHAIRQAVIDTYATDLVCQLAHNDIYNANRTPAQVQTSVQTILGYAPAAVRKFVTTLQPKTTSSDDWATVGNMTADSETPDAQTYNGLVRSGSIAGADGFFDICRALESSADSGKQKATGSAFGYVVDGSHCNRAGQILIRDSGVVDIALIRGHGRQRFASPGDVERGNASNLVVTPLSLMRGGLIDWGTTDLSVAFRTPGNGVVTWTNSGGIDRRKCKWYRVGDLVWCNFRLTFSIAHTTAASRLEVKGWPFMHADNNVSGVVSFHGAQANYDSGRTALFPRFSTISPDPATLIFGMSGDNVDTENFDISNLATGQVIDIMGTITYVRGTLDVWK